MEKKTSPINIMVDKETKDEATKILKEVGLSMSTAINLFLKQVINHNGLPFEVRKPNEDTLRALKAAQDIIDNPDKYPSYHSREELEAALLSDDEL